MEGVLEKCDPSVVPASRVAPACARVALAAVMAACAAKALGEGTGTSAQLRRPSVSTCAITRFEIRGNTVLTAEELDAYLEPLAGPAVGVLQIREKLAGLQTIYRERGRPQALVLAPRQLILDGVVSDHLLDRPLIAYYGAYYRLPLGNGPSVQQQIDASGGRFGYDSATRQFRLQPGGASAELSFYYTGSSSDTGMKFGPAELVSQTPLLSIVSQDSGQNPSVLNNLGTRFSLALPVDEKRRFSLSAGFEAKFVTLECFNSNNFLITTVVTNALGSQTIQSPVSSSQRSAIRSTTPQPGIRFARS